MLNRVNRIERFTYINNQYQHLKIVALIIEDIMILQISAFWSQEIGITAYLQGYG